MKHTVWITGSSNGIGAGIARAFAADGYRVVVHANTNVSAAEALCKEIQDHHGLAMVVCGDVSRETDVLRMAAEARAAFGPIGVLINNAGVALPQQLITDCSEEDWGRVFDVNVKGAFLCTKAVLPDMISEKSGAIVNISSMWGVTGGSCEVPYSASKAALIGFTKALAKEVAPSNVRVNCIAPGFVATHMNGALSEQTVADIVEETPLLRAGVPQDIASAALFLAGDTAAFITGQVLCVDGGRCI